ncbi:MAG: site-2 protease family protein [Clostridia bacterium]|nr:site-2 protease family protein [Clostridia bacterium]
MLTSLFSREGLISLILSIPGLLLAIVFHEMAHGWAAYLMGDRTAKSMGRLSPNPLHHIDPIGAICMLFFRFGWAKPVPINSANFKKRKLGIIMVSLAGPLANFIIAFFCILFAGILINMTISDPIVINWFFDLLAEGAVLDIGKLGASTVVEFFYMVFIYGAILNIGFMVFNLIPIPPLDGSKIVMEFLPLRIKYTIYNYERYFGLILILLVYLGTLTPVLGWLREGVLSGITSVVELMF